MQQKSELFHSKKIQRRRKLTKNNNIKNTNTEDWRLNAAEKWKVSLQPVQMVKLRKTKTIRLKKYKIRKDNNNNIKSEVLKKGC